MRRLFGKRDDEVDDSPGSGLGIDLRDDEELEIERKAKKPLRGDDESLAKRLCNLLSQSKAYEDTPYKEIRRIGEQLNSRGGLARMKMVCYRVGALGGKARLLESYWDNIGEWMG